MMNTMNPAQLYQSTGVESAVNGASPHGLISLLYKEVFTQLTRANGALERSDSIGASQSMTKALSIVCYLQECLEEEAGGDISRNLNDLYDFCKSKLISANVRRSADDLSAVVKVLKPIQEAWDALPDDVKAG